MKIFLYSSSVYFCHFCLVSSASVRSIPFLSFIEPIFAWNVPLVFLIFLKRSLVFPILLFSSISLPWSLWKAFLSLLAILWNSTFRSLYLSFSPLPLTSLLYSAICKASSDNFLPFCIYFSWGMLLFRAQKLSTSTQWDNASDGWSSNKREKRITLPSLWEFRSVFCLLWFFQSITHSNSAIYWLILKVEWKLLSSVWLFGTSWTVALQTLLSLEFSRHEYCSGLLCPSLGVLPTQGSNRGLPYCRLTLYTVWAPQKSAYWPILYVDFM